MSDPSLDKQCEGSDQGKISKRAAGNAVFQNKSAWTSEKCSNLKKRNKKQIKLLDLVIKVNEYLIGNEFYCILKVINASQGFINCSPGPPEGRIGGPWKRLEKNYV